MGKRSFKRKLLFHTGSLLFHYLETNIFLTKFSEQDHQTEGVQKAWQEERGLVGGRQGQGRRRSLGIDPFNVRRIESEHYRIRKSRRWRHQHLLPCVRPSLRASPQDHDVERQANNEIEGQILGPQKLPFALHQGVPSRIFSALWLRLRICAVQVAALAEPAEGEAEDHLGLQDPLPRRHVSARREKDSFRRHWSGKVFITAFYICSHV